jgi:hypothetical protein
VILFQLVVVGAREEGRMRVERGEHALNGGLIGLLVVDLVGVLVRDERENFFVIVLDDGVCVRARARHDALLGAARHDAAGDGGDDHGKSGDDKT